MGIAYRKALKLRLGLHKWNFRFKAADWNEAIAERLAERQPAEAAICGLAGWIRYTMAIDEAGNPYTVDDPLSGRFAELNESSDGDIEAYLHQILQFLQRAEILSPELASAAGLRADLLSWLHSFQQQGVLQTIHARWRANE